MHFYFNSKKSQKIYIGTRNSRALLRSAKVTTSLVCHALEIIFTMASVSFLKFCCCLFSLVKEIKAIQYKCNAREGEKVNERECWETFFLLNK